MVIPMQPWSFLIKVSWHQSSAVYNFVCKPRNLSPHFFQGLYYLLHSLFPTLSSSNIQETTANHCKLQEWSNHFNDIGFMATSMLLFSTKQEFQWMRPSGQDGPLWCMLLTVVALNSLTCWWIVGQMSTSKKVHGVTHGKPCVLMC